MAAALHHLFQIRVAGRGKDPEWTAALAEAEQRLDKLYERKQQTIALQNAILDRVRERLEGAKKAAFTLNGD